MWKCLMLMFNVVCLFCLVESPLLKFSFTFIDVMVYNILFLGMPQIVGFSLIGLGFGIWWQWRSDLYFAERDAIYRHYIELHPEDFKPKGK